MNALKPVFQYLLVACITLLCLEIALRIYAAFPRDAERYIYDEQIGYRERPNFPIREDQITNSRGFNDTELTVEPREDSLRLAIVGDSFVYGAVARDNNFTFVLEDIAQKNGVDLEVINMGISAAGPKNYLGLIKHDVAESGADLVAVTIFVGNDITQAHPHFKTSVWLNSTRETLVKPYLAGLSWEYSYVYRSIRSVSRLVRERIDKTPRKSFTRENFMAIERQRSLIYRRDMSGFIHNSYNEVISVIAEMSREMKLQNKKLFIILAPDELQLSLDIQEHVKGHSSLEPSEFDFTQPQSILTEALSNLRIPVLDLLPFFQEVKDSGELYIQYDTHWNKAGNQLAAEAIWLYLNEESLL